MIEPGETPSETSPTAEERLKEQKEMVDRARFELAEAHDRLKEVEEQRDNAFEQRAELGTSLAIERAKLEVLTAKHSATEDALLNKAGELQQSEAE
ncbi:hypothetical protein U1Q18_051459 [Sarracenia purpurea var. burkii]